MLKELRRIVTGHNANGRSVIVLDGSPSRVIEAMGGGAAEMWVSDTVPADNSTPGDPVTERPVRLDPPSGGSVFRFFVIPPEDSSLTPQQREEAIARVFAEIGAAHERTNIARHPGMHRTRTLDYIVLLRGKVSLLVDEGEVDLKPFDVVVQRGTSHAWANHTKEPALLMAVLIDAKPL